MRVRQENFGGYRLAIYGGGIGVAITAPDARETYLQGDDAALLLADYDSACADMAGDAIATRRGRIGESATARELFDCYFD